jgi:hypothetical protein
MKKITILVLFVLLSTTQTFAGNRYYFYLQNDYHNQKELYGTLFSPKTNTMDELFLWCCDCIMYYAKTFNVSYEFMNLVLFVFLQPTIILILLILYVRERIKRCTHQGLYLK